MSWRLWWVFLFLAWWLAEITAGNKLMLHWRAISYPSVCTCCFRKQCSAVLRLTLARWRWVDVDVVITLCLAFKCRSLEIFRKQTAKAWILVRITSGGEDSSGKSWNACREYSSLTDYGHIIKNLQATETEPESGKSLLVSASCFYIALQVRFLVLRTVCSVAKRDTAVLLVKTLFLGRPFVNSVREMRPRPLLWKCTVQGTLV